MEAIPGQQGEPQRIATPSYLDPATKVGRAYALRGIKKVNFKIHANHQSQLADLAALSRLHGDTPFHQLLDQFQSVKKQTTIDLFFLVLIDALLLLSATNVGYQAAGEWDRYVYSEERRPYALVLLHSGTTALNLAVGSHGYATAQMPQSASSINNTAVELSSVAAAMQSVRPPEVLKQDQVPLSDPMVQVADKGRFHLSAPPQIDNRRARTNKLVGRRTQDAETTPATANERAAPSSFPHDQVPGPSSDRWSDDPLPPLQPGEKNTRIF